MSKHKDWTKEEINTLMDLLSKGKSYKEISVILNRPENGVAIKTQRLYRKEHGNKVIQKKWTDDEIKFLKKSINEFKSPEYVARKLNRTINSVTLKASKLNLSFKGKNRTVREDELNSLEEDWCDTSTSISHLSKKYKRSENALRIIAYRKGFGSRGINSEFLTVRDISECTGVSRDRIKIWFKKGLKYKDKKVGKSRYFVSLEDLILFLEEHQELYDATKIDTCIFTYELPEWFKKKYHKDKLSYAVKSHENYTDTEDRTILSYYKRGKSIKEIALLLKRTESGIKSRLELISEGYMRPSYYTEKEIEILKENSDYMTLEELSTLLKRSVKSIEYKCEKLKLPYHISKNKCKKK